MKPKANLAYCERLQHHPNLLEKYEGFTHRPINYPQLEALSTYLDSMNSYIYIIIYHIIFIF